MRGEGRGGRGRKEKEFRDENPMLLRVSNVQHICFVLIPLLNESIRARGCSMVMMTTNAGAHCNALRLYYFLYLVDGRDFYLRMHWTSSAIGS